ncbi:PHP domain protein [Planctomycetes bacterium Pan216]|uniref:PHP domain protein n=1 Tax=Kolteria novifilia TaxID=2527975 RepID=A0A518B120_9BACT|nr:PHP domain protein [Planctomycetes bacterium Pan216]
MAPPPTLFDLHVHSTRSDGAYSLMQLAEMVRRSGLAGFALTDHDAMGDPEEIALLSDRFGITILPGVELSTHAAERSVHLLGYGVDRSRETLRELCRDLQDQRRGRFDAYREALAKRQLRIASDLAKRLLGTASLGRRHLARELVRAGKATTARDAFRRYLSQIDEVPRLRTPAFAAAVGAIHEAGGVAVVAHPDSGWKSDVWHELLGSGCDGIEVDFPAARRRHRRFLLDIVRDHDLVPTGGSDFHGDEPRSYLGQKTVPGEVLERLRERMNTAAISAKT